MHKMLNGEKVTLSEQEIAEFEADAKENMKEQNLINKRLNRKEMMGSIEDHIDRISNCLAHLKKIGIDIGVDGEKQCEFMASVNELSSQK